MTDYDLVDLLLRYSEQHDLSAPLRATLRAAAQRLKRLPKDTPPEPDGD